MLTHGVAPQSWDAAQRGTRFAIRIAFGFLQAAIAAARRWLSVRWNGDQGSFPNRLVHHAHRIEMRGDSMRKAKGDPER